MTGHTNPTQEQRVLNYIREHGSITQLEALYELGVMRLASRISSLKKQGINIVGENITVINRFNEKCHIKRYKEKEAAQ